MRDVTGYLGRYTQATYSLQRVDAFGNCCAIRSEYQVLGLLPIFPVHAGTISLNPDATNRETEELVQHPLTKHVPLSSTMLLTDEAIDWRVATSDFLAITDARERRFLVQELGVRYLSQAQVFISLVFPNLRQMDPVVRDEVMNQLLSVCMADPDLYRKLRGKVPLPGTTS